ERTLAPAAEASRRAARPRRMVGAADAEEDDMDFLLEADTTTQARGLRNQELELRRDLADTGGDEDGERQIAENGYWSGTTVRVTVTEDGRPAHAVRRCSDAAGLSL